MLVAGGPNVGDAIRDLATEVGFEFDDESTEVIDHKNVHATLVKIFLYFFLYFKDCFLRIMDNIPQLLYRPSN